MEAGPYRVTVRPSAVGGFGDTSWRISLLSLNMNKAKVEIFDINSSKDEQRTAEIRMSGAERLIMVLDLMDLSAALSMRRMMPSKDDGIDWIELKWERPFSKSESP